ncbi:MAG: hypothetical protein AABZ53_06685, partial [Planctomycetota bacterium]
LLGFFAADLEQRKVVEEARIGPKELAGRDTAMVSSAVTAVTSRSAKVSVLIVGIRHLEGITAGLKAAGQSFVVAIPPSARLEGDEDWEVRAWTKRSALHIPVFSPSAEVSRSTPDAEVTKNKELSLLLQALWRRDQRVRYPFLKGLSSRSPIARDGAGAIYDIPGRPGVFLRALSVPPDRDARFGPHVLESAPSPFNKDEWLQVCDRTAALLFARGKSTSDNMFVYSELAQREGQFMTQFIGRDGEWSLPEFVRALPGGGARLTQPRRFVLFGHRGDIREGGVSYSSVDRELRTARGSDGNGGGDPPYVWTSAAHPDEPGPRRRSRVIWTLDEERAAASLLILDRMKAPRKEHVTFIEEADLPNLEQKLHFTPTTGEYSHTFVIVARNTAALREALTRAAKAQLLVNKQIALVTCGDAYAETQSLVQTMLNKGALMVWHPNRQVSPEGAATLRRYAGRIVARLDGATPMDINELVESAILLWHSESPNDPELKPFIDSSSQVRVNDERCRGASDRAT